MAKRRTKSEKRRLKARRGQEHASQAILESREKLLQRIEERRDTLGVDLRIDTNNPVKMSEVILDFAKPLLDLARDFDEQEKAVKLAILAWNLSLLPGKELQKGLDKIRSSAHFEGRSEPDPLETVVLQLIERKQDLFPTIDRRIMDHDVVETPHGLHLNVVSNVTAPHKT
jgi:hypothetical protein